MSGAADTIALRGFTVCGVWSGMLILQGFKCVPSLEKRPAHDQMHRAFHNGDGAVKAA